MANSNKTPFVAYAVWPFVLTALLCGIGIHFHSDGYIWATGLGLISLGVGIMVYQVKTGGDTTALPYFVQFLGLLTFLLMTYLK